MARNEYEQALALYRQVGDQRATAGQLNGLADIVRQSGDLTRAEAMYGECLRIAREQGLHQGVAATLINLADLAANRSDWEVARKRMEESLSLGRQTGHIRTIASALGTLAFYHVLHSNHDQARSSAAEGLEISREIGNTLLETHLVLTVAMIAEAAGDRKLAARLAAGAETMRHALGAPPDPRTLGGPTGAVWARFESDDEPDRFENESENSSDGEFGNESDAATEPGADRGPMGDPVASFTQLTEIARAFCSPQTSFDPA